MGGALHPWEAMSRANHARLAELRSLDPLFKTRHRFRFEYPGAPLLEACQLCEEFVGVAEIEEHYRQHGVAYHCRWQEPVKDSDCL